MTKYKDILQKPKRWWTPVGLVSFKRCSPAPVSTLGETSTGYPHRVEPNDSLDGINFMTGHHWLVRVMGDRDKSNNTIDGKHSATDGGNNPEKEKGNVYRCVHCNKTYKGEKCFCKHLRKCSEAHWRLKGPEDNSVICAKCGNPFKKKGLIYHSRKCDVIQD